MILIQKGKVRKKNQQNQAKTDAKKVGKQKLIGEKVFVQEIPRAAPNKNNSHASKNDRYVKIEGFCETF